MPEACSSRYARHIPEETALYRIVQEHLEMFLEHVKMHSGRQLPRYVVAEFRRYLECGILAHGFGRARCNTCGHEIFVAFSCKLRGICSCNARRMCETAANLTDYILPDSDLRQWVLSVPFELRLLLAAKPDALSAVGRLFVQEVARWQRVQARLLGHKRVHTGAVCFPQRFGSSLNLNVHYHVLTPDAVFVPSDSDEPATLVPLGAPTPSALEDIVFNTAMRCIRWLVRRGYVRAEDDEVGEQQHGSPSPLLSCLQGALGLGELYPLPRAKQTTRELTPAKGTRGLAATSHRFNLHAGIFAPAGCASARERLARYCARAPLSLERLSLLADGSIAYRVKAQGGRHEARRVMSPLQFMARLAALVPPPRHPLIRFFGVFASHHARRQQAIALCPTATCPAASPASASPSPAAQGPPPNSSAADGGDEEEGASSRSRPAESGNTPDHDRLALVASGEPPRPRLPVADSLGRIAWAVLLKRVHDVDALQCDVCGGRMRFVDVVEDKLEARAILEAHAQPSLPPPLAKARAPDWFDA